MVWTVGKTAGYEVKEGKKKAKGGFHRLQGVGMRQFNTPQVIIQP